MTLRSLYLPRELLDFRADLAKTNRQTAHVLPMGVLSAYIKLEKMLTTQIEQAVRDADEGKFATDEQVAAIGTKRWIRTAG